MSRTRILIVGAGSAGRSLVQEIRDKQLPVQPVAFLDDDPALQGTEICGLPVLGGTDALPEAAARSRAEQALLAIPSAGGPLIRRMVLLAKQAGLPLRIVPGLRDIILGDVSYQQVAEVRPEHLLGRESVDFGEEPA
ncbi:polysaccharide biosynthesis protein, partial [bacterium CG17_big_fil_post_rev_8_21_14_2_50_64_8]